MTHLEIPPVTQIMDLIRTDKSLIVISTFSTFWQRKAGSHMSNSTLPKMNESNISAGLKGQSQGNVVTLRLEKTSTNDLSKGQVNWAYQYDTTMCDSDSDTGCHGDDSISHRSHYDDEEKGMPCVSGTHSIILDLSSTSFVDTVTVKTLKNVRVCQDLSVFINLTIRCLNKLPQRACSSTFSFFKE